jgi:release factor glutamine methyltransferase
VLDTDRGGLWIRRPQPLDPPCLERYERSIARRERREPVQHVLGFQEFHGLAIRVDARALVPRPETEGLVDAVLECAPPGADVADLGTGTGCLAIALAVRRPDLSVRALDRSADALALARENLALHGLSRRIELVRGDLAHPPAAWLGRLDVVVSNPPYVGLEAWRGLAPEVRDYEPREALVPGPTGYEAYAALAPAAAALLRPGGRLVAELGYGQDHRVREIVEGAGFGDVRIRDDLNGIPRVLVARHPGPDRRRAAEPARGRS